MAGATQCSAQLVVCCCYVTTMKPRLAAIILICLFALAIPASALCFLFLVAPLIYDGQTASWMSFIPFFVICVVVLNPLLIICYRASKNKRFSVLMALVFFYVSLVASIVFCVLCVGGNISSPYFALIPLYYLHGCVWLQLCLLSRERMRPLLYRLLVSWPAMWYISTIVFSLPFLPLVALLPRPLPAAILGLSGILAIIGIYQTLHSRPASKWKTVDLVIPHISGIQPTTQSDSNADSDTKAILPNKQFLKPRRLRIGRPSGRPRNSSGALSPTLKQCGPLRLAVITDPHLGPIMSVARLRYICENAVALSPDLVLLTGDFFTLEAHGAIDYLVEALEPLRPLAVEGKVFACFGNHDKELPHVVELTCRALETAQVRLLVDEEAIVSTQVGDVQVIGMDWCVENRLEHVTSVCRKFPPRMVQASVGTEREQMWRVIMLHDPGAFRFVPAEESCLVISGHTHGGQIGLLSLGLNGTLVGLIGVPDHGFWGRGKARLYVHRGQGCRTMLGTFVARLGVPTEESILRVFREDE